VLVGYNDNNNNNNNNNNNSLNFLCEVGRDCRVHFLRLFSSVLAIGTQSA